VDVLLLVRIVVGEHIPEGFLVYFPQHTFGVGNAGCSARTVVEEGEFSEGTALGAGPNVLAIDGEANLSVLDDVEVITDFSLLDDDGGYASRNC